jgi:membrane protease YdiL (CAAX protease family)
MGGLFMKERFFRVLGFLVMWGMIVLTTIQSDTILWLLLATATFIIIYFIGKWTKVTSDLYFGLQFHKAWLRFLMIGVVLGSGYSIIRFFILYNTGAISVIKLFPAPLSTVIIPTIFLIVSNCYIAFSEEMVFRGYLIHALPRKLKWHSSILISALLFLLGHSLNGITSVTRIIELLFLGLTLGIIYVGTKSLWAAVGLHFGLDFFGFFLGGDGEASRQYILLAEKTNNYVSLMRLTDAILPVVIFVLVILITKLRFASSSSKMVNKEG